MSALVAGGGYIGQLKTHDQRLDRVEAKLEKINTIDTRMAGIEAKLEILIDQSKQDRSQDRERSLSRGRGE